MRVVSMVPSWTETLLHAGVEVVGRTRFCVHPELTQAIPVVGGTKDWKPEELARLAPDVLLLDREENVMNMAAAGPWRVHSTHVRGTEDVPRELDDLSALFGAAKLACLAEEWRTELESPVYPDEGLEIPGVLEWIRRPVMEPEVILYLIWRGPWLAVSRNTFVGAMLSHLGFGGRIPHFDAPYPKIDLGDYDPAKTLLLFSSEPYPFRAKRQELLGLDFPAAVVDGESYSWFGLRSLRFLQSLSCTK